MTTPSTQSVAVPSFTERKPEASGHSAHTNAASDKRSGLTDIGQGRLAGNTRGSVGERAPHPWDFFTWLQYSDAWRIYYDAEGLRQSVGHHCSSRLYKHPPPPPTSKPSNDKLVCPL
jgi:hypothetical protein